MQNGISIKYSETYDQNPLRLINTANGAAVSEADRATLEITYSVSDRVGTGVAEIDPATGVLTLHSTGTVRVKVEAVSYTHLNRCGKTYLVALKNSHTRSSFFPGSIMNKGLDKCTK